MKKLGQIIFWCHLIAGVTAGIVILIMSVTGVLLAFEPQIIRFAEREMQAVKLPQGEAQRLGAQALFARALEAKPNATPTALTLQADPNAAAVFMLGREGVLYLNPYTGEVTGEGAKSTRVFFRFVEDWHRWLGAGGENRAVGRAVTGACNTAFLILAVTGVYLWWPKKWMWRNLKLVIFFKRGLKARARDFNWHNVTGFWSSAALIVITATGIVMSYQWANNLLYTLTGSQPPAQQGPANPGVPTDAPRAGQATRATSNQGAGRNGEPNREAQMRQGEAMRQGTQAAVIPVNLDQLWSHAEQQAPGWQAITLRLPPRSDAPLTFSIREGRSWLEAASSQLTLNPATTEIVKWEPYATSSLGRRLRTWVRFLHTGEAGGVPGQIIALLASLGGSFLVWTGLSLAWRRFRGWIARRLKKPNLSAKPDIELIPDSRAN